MNIKCNVITTDNKFKTVFIPSKLLKQLCENLVAKNQETIYFADDSIDIKGIFVGCNEFKGNIVIMPLVDDCVLE